MSVQALQLIISAQNDALENVRKTQEAIEGLQRSARSVSNAGDRLSSFGGAMTRNVTAPIAAGLGAATWAAVQFEDSLTSLNKAYGFDAGSQQALQAQRVVQDLSLELGRMPTDVAAIATEAGKLGVKFNQLNDYTRMVTQSSVAFDMSAQNAGESLGILTNVLGYMNDGVVDIQGLTRLGDTINHLADSGATSESAIVNVLKRAGGTTRTFGLASESAAGLAAAFLNLGDAPEVVGTAMNSMLPALMNASRGTSKFQKGLESLGLDAKGFEQAVRKDASGALLDFITRLGKAENASAIVSDMFGTGSDSSMLLKAAKNAEQFRKTMEGASKVKAGGMLSTFEKQSSTTSAALERLKTNMFILGTTIGAAILPPLNQVLAAITPLVQKFAEFGQANPKIIQMAVAFAAVLAAVGPVLIVVGQLISAIGAIGGAIAGIQGFMALVAAMAAGVVPATGFAGAVAGIATAIGAIGFGPIIAGIAALAAGAYLVVTNWSSISSFFSGLFSRIASAVQPALQGLMQFAQGFVSGLVAGLQPALPALQQMGAAFQSMFMSMWQVGAALVGLVGSILQFVLAAAQLTPLGMIISMIGTAFQQAGVGASQFGAMVGAAIGLVVSGLAMVAAATANVIAAFSSMASQITGIISGLAGQMFSAGANLMQMLANGIMSAAGAVTSAISSIASQVAGFLPGSPVDTGPLRVFNSGYTGSTLMEMLAGGIQSYPIDGVMGAALSPVAAQTAGIVPTSSGAGITPTGAMGGGSGGGAITLTYAPQITIGAGGTESEGSFREMLEAHKEEIMRLLASEQRRKERLAYG